MKIAITYEPSEFTYAIVYSSWGRFGSYPTERYHTSPF